MGELLQIDIRLAGDAFWATVREFPGVFATGDSLQELRESLEEGIALVLAERDEPLPPIELGALHHQLVEILANAELEGAELATATSSQQALRESPQTNRP